MGATMDGPVKVPQTDELDNLVPATAAERAPDQPATPAGKWIKDNLFSSVGNTIQTVVFSLLLLGVTYWLLGLVFEEEADWRSVGTNIRLLLTYNYPPEQFVRIWVSVGLLSLAAGLSLGAWQFDPAVTVRKLGVWAMGGAGLAAVLTVLMPFVHAPTTIVVAAGVVTVVLGAAGFVALNVVDRPHLKMVPILTVFLGATVTAVAVLWLVPFGRYSIIERDDGVFELVARSGTISLSGKVPWTVMAVIFIAALVVGRAIARRLTHTRSEGGVEASGTLQGLRSGLVLWWLVGPAFIIFLVLRDPDFDYDQIARVDLPVGALFALGGAALLYALTSPARAELARLVGALIVALAVGLWVAAFAGLGYDSFPIPLDMKQKFRITVLALGLATLAAPSFAGERSKRIRYAVIWIAGVTIAHWLITGINTPSTLDIVAPPFLGGFVLTVSIAYYVMLASFPLGVLLALARTSKMPIFRILATTFIEVVRGIPLITVLFFFSIMLPLFLPDGMDISELAAVFTGYALFSAAYMAENIRGGLQSVRKGQFEAADALGLTTFQRTSLIVLPQALRVSIPNLVGQAIATFKETSLIAIVGGFDLLRIADKVVPNQSAVENDLAVFVGQKKPALLFICLVYWVFAYAMSRSSRALEERLGVGQGR